MARRRDGAEPEAVQAAIQSLVTCAHGLLGL